jgi:hypothetical protein
VVLGGISGFFTPVGTFLNELSFLLFLPPDSTFFTFLFCSLALAMAALSFSDVPV